MRAIQPLTGATMMIRLAWALVAGTLLLAATGCGEVESCERGDVGCIDGPVNSVTSMCKFGLVPNAQGTCVKKDGSGSGPTDACGGCPAGSLCNDALQCVNICTLPPNLPVKKLAPPACRPAAGEAPYDFATAAVAACTQECLRRAEYCGGGCDPAAVCTPANAQLLVAGMNLCPGRDPECAMRACEMARDKPCQAHSCVGGPPGAVPNCAGVVCDDSCPGFPEYVKDGVCDDGDLSNAISAVCRWGTDCGDCGPRRGAAPPFDLGLADLCVDPIQCGGDTTDVRLASGWCVRIDLAVTVLRCVPDCSTSGDCPAGFECNDLVYQDDDGSTTTLTDDNGKTARACFPNACGI